MANLTPKKITVQGKKGKFTRTYWVKAEQSYGRLRDVRASIQSAPLPQAPVTGGLAAAPSHKEPPRIEIPRVQIEMESFPHRRARNERGEPIRVPLPFQPERHTERVMDLAYDGMLGAAGALTRAFSDNPSGVASFSTVNGEQMTRLSGPHTQAVYIPTQQKVVFRDTTETAIAAAIYNKDVDGPSQYNAINVFTHEVLHGASNKNAPPVEARGAASSPNRWLEEATTELLAQHYAPQMVQALTGRTMPSIVTVEPRSLTSGAVSVMPTGQTYPYQCQRFANLAAAIGGATEHTAGAEVNKLVLGYAAAVKARGADRYDYLAEEAMRVYGVPGNHPERPEAKKRLTSFIKDFMGKKENSTLTAGNDQTEAALPALENILINYRQLPAPPKEPTPLPPTPEPARPAVQFNNRRKSLKVQL